MKKIILSLAIIAVVGVVAVGATRAYFSDTITSTGNTFTAGTIDIALGAGNLPVHLEDMKPSQVGYSNFVVTNTGTNPVNVTKTIQNLVSLDNSTNEPECLDESGTWSTTTSTCSGAGWIQKKDIDSVITYDLSVKVFDGATLVWNQTLNDMDVTIAAKNGQPSFLGMLPAGSNWRMEVTESYHMASSTGNWAQSDSLSFDIAVAGTQLTGVATLSNKDANRPVADGWFVLGTKTGTLTYGVKDSTFNYSFTGTAPLASTGYTLVMYREPSSTPSASGWPRAVTILGAGTTDSTGAITLTGTPDTSSMLNAKIWLVKTTDLVGSTLSGWNPTEYLFDTGMIDYYKS